MAAYDYIRETTNQDFGTDLPANGLNRIHKVQRSINFETACAALKASVDFATGDVLKIIDIPAYTWVVAVFAETTTASDAIDDIDIGDETQTAGWVDDVDVSATEDDNSLDSVSYGLANAGGKLYSTADTIDIKINTDGASDDGVLKVTALMVDVS